MFELPLPFALYVKNIRKLVRSIAREVSRKWKEAVRKKNLAGGENFKKSMCERVVVISFVGSRKSQLFIRNIKWVRASEVGLYGSAFLPMMWRNSIIEKQRLVHDKNSVGTTFSLGARMKDFQNPVDSLRTIPPNLKDERYIPSFALMLVQSRGEDKKPLTIRTCDHDSSGTVLRFSLHSIY